MALRIGDLTVATTFVGTDVFEFSLAGSAGSRRVTGGSLRTQLLAGGTGFTAADPLTVGDITSSGSATIAAAGSFAYTGRGSIRASADGIFNLFNAAASSFSRLTFGGTTSSFPSLKRLTTTLTCRLADDSADAGFLCGALTASGTLNGVAATFTSTVTSIVTTNTEHNAFFGENTSAGNAARARFVLRNNNSEVFSIAFFGTGFSSSSPSIASGALISNGAGVINLNPFTTLGVFIAGSERMRISAPGAAETALMIYDNDNATLERVTVGAADSGGSGFKVLRIPN